MANNIFTGLLGGFASGVGAVASTAMTNRANRQLAEYSYSKDLEMWNRQNEYNSPQAQMERLQSAGLNPAMMYGQGSQAAGQAKEMPKYNAPTMDYTMAVPMIAQTLSAFQDIKVKQAQEKSILADIPGKEADSEYKSNSLWYRVSDAVNRSHISLNQAGKEKITYEIMLALEKAGIQFDQAKAQLGISQADVGKHKADALIRNIEAELYENLRKLGAGTNVARVLVPLLQTLIKK